MDEHGLASDLLDEKYRAPGVIAENQSNIREIFVNFLANLTRDEAYHGLQKRGSNTGRSAHPMRLCRIRTRRTGRSRQT